MPRLVRIIGDLRDSSAVYMSLFLELSTGNPAALKEHAAIVDACRDGDAKRAAELVRTHLSHSLEVVSTGLSEAAEG
jgi:DNA-binding GntR family transcriptional regulator